MALSIHRSERADALVRGLGAMLAATPADPFSADLVAVPSRGVERWIAQSLSTTLGAASGSADGVCANVAFPAPCGLVAEAVAVATGIDPETDPWAEHRLTWALLDVIDACAGEDWCRTLGRHLGLVGGRVDQGRRVAVAQKLAGLFTGYAAQRPAMLREWAAGQDTDGAGSPLGEDVAWQAELWRRLRAAVGVASPAERVEDACARLREDPGLVDLPERLSIFGPTRITADQIAVLEALAEHRDVHLWLPHPSYALWDRVAAARPALSSRRDDPTADLPRHPLLGSCGRDAREMQVRLAAAPVADEHLPGAASPGTLLGRLQQDIREDRAPGADHPLADDDRSVQVHACHGRQRQVEVLREVLLGLMEDDPTLEPRDIIVMCPDIESYAPLISAAFGLAVDDAFDEVHPGHRLRVRLADRSLRQTNPVLTFVGRLLDLADARLTVSEVLDLAAMPAVRARFGFDDDELERLGDWVRRSGVRWGLDAEARAPYRLDGVRQNTWQTGLDRVLVGVAMDEDDLRTVGMALPLDDVDSNEADLAGRLAELVDRLALAVAALTGRQPLTAWVEALLTAVDDLTWAPPYDEWQTSEARRELTDALGAAGDRADTVPLTLNDVRAVLAHRLRGRPTRANFRTGQLTMCTMVPMRSVPHRVVCLLGVDDGVFPRGTHADGDDVLARTPRVGERDPRSEDRQLFLDAVLAAGERLVVLYTGADERTGAERPPAVPLGELLDVLDRTARVPVRSRILVRHPLQPFDARNFVDSALGVSGPFSFDTASYDGARALLGDRRPRPPFLAEPLPDDGVGDTVELEALVAFLEHPAKAFLRRRLGLSAVAEEEEPADALPVELDHLARWGIGDRLLTAGLAGVDREQAVRAEWLRGDLPPGPLGNAVVAPLADDVEALVTKTAGLRAGTPESLDVAVDLDCGIRLVGTVPGVYGDRVVRVVYSRLGAKHRLRAWVYLLMLVASRPDRTWAAATVGRGRSDPMMSCLVAPPAEVAREVLGELVALYRAGQREPLPLAPKTSCSYAEKRRAGSPVKASQAKAATEWRKNFDGRDIGEYDDADHARVWGDAPFQALLTGHAREGAWAEEDTWFGQLARTVWDPLLTAETVVG
ncbi:MAG: exodeoxyribonuclease V subunit gamma [Nocardioidaceae bacterium]